MKNVGLTGSIAVGKTFVCNILCELGCHVLDADKTAREVVEPGSLGLRSVVEHFGKEILLENGELDRKKLGAIAFADKEKLELLNSIIHPLVIEKQNEWLQEKEADDPNGIAIVDAALMIESGGYKRFDKLIVVWCQPGIQFARLIERDKLSKDEAKHRITSQMPQEEKKKYADMLIDTSGTRDETIQRTKEIFELLRSGK